MQLSKHHGLRNDFLVVLDETNDEPVPAGPELARRLCDRRAGLGADGLIHGARPDPDSDADVVMHLWNADGSRAEMSGNGIRCLAQAVARARGLGEATLTVESDTGRRGVTVTGGPHPGEVGVRVDLGEVGPGPGLGDLQLPVAAKEVQSADLGNPHVVVLLDEARGDRLADVDLAHVGPLVEAHFPDGMNVELIVPGAEPDTLDLRVWERGAGITEACGTGACAAAHLAHEWGLVGTEVTVRMPGGDVVVALRDGHAFLHGPAVLIADILIAEIPAADSTAVEGVELDG